MRDLSAEKIARITPYLQGWPALTQLMQRFGLILAGGAVRDLTNGSIARDLDLYGNEHHLKRAEAFIRAEGYKIDSDTDAYLRFRLPNVNLPVELIKLWPANSMDECLNKFDFICCMGAVRFTPERILIGRCEERFGTVALALNHTSPPHSYRHTFLRMLKFYNRGYMLPAITIGELVIGMSRQAAERGITVEELLNSVTTTYGVG